MTGIRLHRAAALGLGCALASMLGRPAHADEGEPPSDGAVLLRTDAAATPGTLRPWLGQENRLGRELTWARWLMAGDSINAQPTDARERAEQLVLDLAQMRGDALLQRPGAGASALTALGSVAAAGLPVLGIWRDGRLRQRHSLRAYSRGRGFAVAWRIEF